MEENRNDHWGAYGIISAGVGIMSWFEGGFFEKTARWDSLSVAFPLGKVKPQLSKSRGCLRSD